MVIPVKAESNPTVITFEIQGNTHIATEKILGVVSNTKMGSPLDPQMVQRDEQEIMALGYFTDVQVKTEKNVRWCKTYF